MLAPTTLTDEEIFKRTQQLRQLASQGDSGARSLAEEYVAEAQRRFRHADTLAPALADEQPVSKRAWWQFR